MRRITVLSLVLMAVLLTGAPGVGLAQGTCKPDAAFGSDVTVPDNTVFSPGQSFEKVWRLKNRGTCDWGEGYTLNFVRGDPLGAAKSQPITTTVAAGSMADIGVKMVAPEKDGVYTSHWQMADAKGKSFGAEVYVKIVVGAPPKAATPAPTVAAPGPSAAAGKGRLINLTSGGTAYLFEYTPTASPGTPEFQEQKRQALYQAACECAALDPRPDVLAALPLDKARNEIEADTVLVRGSFAPDLATTDPGAIVVPQRDQGVLLILNWTGFDSSIDVPPHSVRVPPKQGELPGKVFLPLAPGVHKVVGTGTGVNTRDWEVEISPGVISVLPLSVVGY